MLHPNIASIYRLKMAHLARTLEKLARGVDGGARMSHARRLCGGRPASGARIVSGPHGAIEWEVMAFLAHRTAKEASRYTEAANRAKLTSSGMAKLGADHEQILSNLSERLDKRGF